MPFPDAGRKEAANKEDATDKPCGLCGQPVLDKEDTEFIRGAHVGQQHVWLIRALGP